MVKKKLNRTSNSRPFWHFGRCERRQKWQIHLIVHLIHAWVEGWIDKHTIYRKIEITQAKRKKD